MRNKAERRIPEMIRIMELIVGCFAAQIEARRARAVIVCVAIRWCLVAAVVIVVRIAGVSFTNLVEI